MSGKGLKFEGPGTVRDVVNCSSIIYLVNIKKSQPKNYETISNTQSRQSYHIYKLHNFRHKSSHFSMSFHVNFIVFEFIKEKCIVEVVQR